MRSFGIVKDTWNHNNEMHFHSNCQEERDQEWESIKKRKGAKFRVDKFGQETITFDSPYPGYLNHIYGHIVYKKTSWNN